MNRQGEEGLTGKHPGKNARQTRHASSITEQGYGYGENGREIVGKEKIKGDEMKKASE